MEEKKSSKPVMIVKSAKFSPDQFLFDLGRFNGEHYGNAIDMLFGTEKWNDMQDKRNKLCLAINKPGSNPAVIARGIIELDKKLSYELYSYMAMHCLNSDDIPDSDAPQTVMDFFLQFDGDEEKVAVMDKFWATMRRIYILSDIAQGYINEAIALLNKLEEGQKYVNLFSLKASMDNMYKVAKGLTKMHTEEENDLFHDYCDSIEKYINMRSKVFDKKIDSMEEKRKRANEKERIAKRKASGRK